MAVLDSELQEKIDDSFVSAFKEFTESGDAAVFENKIELAWELYPDPKNNWNEAYNSARDLAFVYIKRNEIDKAKKWLNRMIEVNNNLHHNDDELRFYLGKYYYHIHNVEEAMTHFNAVVKSSGYRYFKGKDDEYLKFYRANKK